MPNKFLSQVLTHPVTQNSLSLFIVQIARYILSLITIPYLARVLGPELWGLVIFTQASAHWLVVLLDYGFNLSATREIARYRDNEEKISEIVASIIGAFGLLLVGSGLVVLLMGLSIPAFREHPDYLIWSWMIAIAQGSAPFWYFQGIERMQMPAVLNLIVRTLAVIATFVCIKSADDAWKVLALQGTGGLLVSGMMLAWMYYQISWRIPSLASSIAALRMGWSMFFFQGSVSLYTTANVFILGLRASASQVAFYGGAERITRSMVYLLEPINKAMFPRMSYLLAHDFKRAANLARISILIMGLGGLLFAISLVVATPQIVHIILGEKFEPAIPLLRLLVFLIPIVALSNFLVYQWMMPLRLDNFVNAITISAGLINLFLAMTFTPKFGAMGMASAVIFSEIFVVITAYIILLKKGFSIYSNCK
jgi:PST family polysaccharide transporter